MRKKLLTLTILSLLAAPVAAASKKAAAPPPADGKTIPAVGASVAFTVPAAKMFKLRNGIPVTVIEGGKVPLFHVVVNAYTGSASDPSGQSGLAAFAVDVMNEGTKTRNAVQISDAFQDLAADFGIGASLESTTASLSCLEENAAACLDVFADVLRNPTFPDADTERVREERKNSLIASKDDPAGIASRAFRRVLWGDRGMGRRTDGTLTELAGLDKAQLAEWHGRTFVPGNVGIVVASRLDLGTVRSLLEGAFGDWAAGVADAPPAPLAAKATESAGVQVYWIHRPGMTQSQLRVGHATPSFDASVFPALSLGNLPLGGHFSSRLNLNLRENKGYTYGARSGFALTGVGGIFEASAGVKAATTAASITEFIKEIKELVGARAVTDAEFDAARRRSMDGYPSSFERGAAVAGTFASADANKRPAGWTEKLPTLWSKVTRSQAQAVLSKWIRPDRLVILGVGDWTTVGKDVDALGLGTVTFLDEDGQPAASPGAKQ